MSGPMAGIRYLHIALARGAAAIEERALKVHDTAGAEALWNQVVFLDRINRIHTEGEELGMFPPLEAKAPHVAGTYLLDHEEEREIFRELGELLAKWTAAQLPDVGARARIARQAAALHDAMKLHIRKEEELVVPLIERYFTVDEQAAMMGRVLSTIMPADMRVMGPWLIGALDPGDREIYLGELMAVMPLDRIVAIAGWLKSDLRPADWADLKRRLPTLPG